MADELFELRNYFYLGNLTAAWTEGETVSAEEETTKIEKSVMMARIQIARKEFDSVISTVKDTDAPALQVVKVLANLLRDPTTKETALANLTGWLADNETISSPCFAIMCAIVYAHLGDFDNSLRVANRCKSLEARAIAVHVMLAMDRADAAAKEVAVMQRVDEDATLTQLASAWTKLATGTDVQDAVYIFQDLLERHGATDTILNGLALCALARGKSDEAERSLQEALSKNPNCSSTLINAVVTARYRNKPTELISRYFEQLTRVAPSNAWLNAYTEKEKEFDALAAQIESS